MDMKQVSITYKNNYVASLKGMLNKLSDHKYSVSLVQQKCPIHDIGVFTTLSNI